MSNYLKAKSDKGTLDIIRAMDRIQSNVDKVNSSLSERSGAFSTLEVTGTGAEVSKNVAKPFAILVGTDDPDIVWATVGTLLTYTLGNGKVATFLLLDATTNETT